MLRELAELIKELDRNNDGKVDFKELRQGAGSFKKETLKFFFEVSKPLT
jgi:Ca2+-binding EF-hand superfamily protein